MTGLFAYKNSMKIYIIIIIIINNIFIINTIRSLPLQDEHAKGQYRAFQVIQGDEKISKLSILAPYWWASTVNKSQWKKSECKKGKNGFTRRWNFTIFKIRPTGLPTHLPTLPGLLRDAGYSTHLVKIYQNHKWFFFIKNVLIKSLKLHIDLKSSSFRLANGIWATVKYSWKKVFCLWKPDFVS